MYTVQLGIIQEGQAYCRLAFWVENSCFVNPRYKRGLAGSDLQLLIRAIESGANTYSVGDTVINLK